MWVIPQQAIYLMACGRMSWSQGDAAYLDRKAQYKWPEGDGTRLGSCGSRSIDGNNVWTDSSRMRRWAKVKVMMVYVPLWCLLVWLRCNETYMFITVAGNRTRRSFRRSLKNYRSSRAMRKATVTPASCSIKKWDGIYHCCQYYYLLLVLFSQNSFLEALIPHSLKCTSWWVMMIVWSVIQQAVPNVVRGCN